MIITQFVLFIVSEIDWMEDRRKKAENVYTTIQQKEEDDLIQQKEEYQNQLHQAMSWMEKVRFQKTCSFE